jgi:alkylresorcinol/alkylpyrone synthase
VPDLVRSELRPFVDGFLATRAMTVRDVDHWIAHPGGPKVLLALEEALGIDRAHTQLTWDSLRDVGNLSSASVLHVLQQVLCSRRPQAGETGVMVAMGPGFSAELVLLRW